jgi:hypothetical protein
MLKYDLWDDDLSSDDPNDSDYGYDYGAISDES